MNSNNKPNKLINEKSPYLLQHAYNPVNWFAWGEEAFEKAKQEDKLILLSIGYATCHWCHVMERESFEDENTAAVMNENFVSIKLDREERPDIDKIYMDALHAMNQQGGWPLNMFLTPDRKPIAGGTYFPPIEKYGRKSFIEVMTIISDMWKTRRDELIQSSESIVEYLKQEELAPNSKKLPSLDSFDNAYKSFNNYFDTTYYGFKTNMVNKFPPSMGLSFLMHYGFHKKNNHAVEMTDKTLQAMKKGGIYDQVGGGICRYATDQEWLVPHFEKMLYDNSLYLISLAEFYSITKEEFFKEAYYDIITYLHRDMKLESGGIASAEDADSEGEEGKFYVWEIEEFRKICTEDSKILEKFWNVTESGNFEHHTILNENFHEDFLSLNGLDKEKFNEILIKNKAKLLEVRSKRIRPLRDDKVLTSWNCLYIRALAIGSMIFQDEKLLDEAKITYQFLENKLIDENKRLLRRFRENESRFKAYLTDYAEFIQASLFLYFSSFNTDYVKKAKFFMDETIRLFLSPNGAFFDTGSDSEELIRRSIDGYDGVEPSGNSSISFCLNLFLSLGIETDKYENLIESLFQFFSEDIEKRGISYPYMLKSYLYYTTNTKQIVVTGKKEDTDVKKVLEYFKTNYFPNTILIYHDGNKDSESIVPILKDKYISDECKIYICENQTCSLPINSLEELKNRSPN